MLALMLVLLAAGGWYGYQMIGLDGVRPVIERLTTLIPLPNSSRTAADTSFGNEGESAPVAAEQAISELEQRIRQQNGDDIATTQSPSSVDPATEAVDGPPIPAFKPSLSTTRSLSTSPVAATTDDAELVSSDGAAAEGNNGAFSIFERLWRYINPG